MRPTLAACVRVSCPSRYECRHGGEPPARDRLPGPPGATWGCAATVGGPCRLCGVRPDLGARRGPDVGEQVRLEMGGAE